MFGMLGSATVVDKFMLTQCLRAVNAKATACSTSAGLFRERSQAGVLADL
jgi:hypothetical protein